MTTGPRMEMEAGERPYLSIVSPVYMAEELVAPLVKRVSAAAEGIGRPFEIVLVEDGSPDGSWEAIRSACAKHPHVVGAKLSRNFGQHHAISAGLAIARGEWVVVMDCDLQDRPEEIKALLDKAHTGYDAVLARRAVRQDGPLKRLSSSVFYSILGWLTGVPQDPAIANFGVYHRKLVDAIVAMPESIRYFPTMVRWVGFRRTTVDVEHATRPSGRTSYGLRKLIHLALDICLAYSDKPLRLVVLTGMLVSFVGFGFAVYTILMALRGEIAVLGYASLIVSIWILSGLVILILGVVGLYVGKTFEGVKQRPAFIIDTILRDAH